MKQAFLAAIIATTGFNAAAQENDSQRLTVQAADLYVNADKFKRKPIEVKNMRCYYANRMDYRCSSAELDGLAVFSKQMDYPDDYKFTDNWMFIENNCDTIEKAMTSKKCKVNLKFSFVVAETDITSGYNQRVVIHANLPVATSAVIGKPKNKRK